MPDDLDDLDTPEDLPDDAPDWAKRNRERADKAVAARNAVREENSRLLRENALLKSGLGTLPEDRQTALFAALGKDITAEALTDKAVAFGWAEAPTPPPPSEAEQAVEGAARISAATQGGQQQGSSVITTADFKSWDQSKKRRFMTEHPVEFRLLRDAGPDGQISGLAFL